MIDKLEVIYEDNHVIVVVKPFNILSQSDITKDVDMLTLVKQYIKEKYQKPGNVYLGLVHRLDRPTKGIMVFARTSKAASRLSDAMRKHEFEKKYVALVHGILPNSTGVFEDYIEKREEKSVICDVNNGKFASLSYKVLKEDKEQNLSLVDISLKTGRHHQIRLQFASRGYPLCGDQKYGLQDKKQLCLIAYYLSFYHPVTKEKLVFSIDYDELENILL